MASSPLAKVKTFADLVKFEHSIFALPFAYLGMFLAARGWPTWHQFVWITLAMVGARTAAMALNRLIDAALDALNPRTATRHIPAGKVKPGEALALVAGSLALLGVAAWQLSPLALRLFPLVVISLVVYSYLKRFTWLCHFWLGYTDGWAPFGAWVAVANATDPLAWWLGLIVALWVGGFDVLYATQDMEWDRSHGLYSIPARFGLRRSLQIARAMHLAVVALTLYVGFAAGFLSGFNPLAWSPAGWLYLVGWAILAGLLHYEHHIISPEDMSRLDAAFFNVNGYISVAYFVFTAAATVVHYR